MSSGEHREEPAKDPKIEPAYFVEENGVVRVYYGDREVGFGYTLDRSEPIFNSFYLRPWAYVLTYVGDIKPYFPWHWCYGKLNKWYPCLTPLVFSNKKLEGVELIEFITERSKLLTPIGPMYTMSQNASQNGHP
jgi:hypothetical protein